MYNQFKTILLLGTLTALLLFVGQLLGSTTGLIFAGFFVVAMNLFSYFYSDKLVLKMYKAHEVKDKSHKLYQIVDEVRQRANLPMPKVYIIPDRNANAFATGRNPKHAAVAATEGIINLLNDHELKGVMAHEMAHVGNRDILIGTVAGTIAGVIGYIGSMAQWAAIFGGGRDRNGGMIQLLVLAIITPLIATIIQLAVSRSREYLADETGARIMQDASGLSSALKKLHSDANRNPMQLGNQSTAHLFIANPFSARHFSKLLSTHPPMDARVKKLDNLRF